MNWREIFVDYVGSGWLPGVSVRRWWRLLRDNSFAISPSCLLRAFVTTLPTPMNSVLNRVKEFRFGSQICATTVAAPIFVLGHYRSGTTHLHNLLTQDLRFAAPTFYQTIFPHAFLTTEAINTRIVNFVLPTTRPFDNVRQHSGMALEDEFSMCSINGLSPYMSWAFPGRAEHYDRFLTFRDATDDERNRWRGDFHWLLQKLTLKHRRTLVLKSPPHTARIGMLLELFPDAKFVHIHRDPYTVFQSTVRMSERSRRIVRLQRGNHCNWRERIFRHYIEMHDAYFDNANRIPSGNLCLVRFDDLDRDPLGELLRIYETLRLPSFVECEHHMRAYIESVRGYKKNVFPDLSADLRKTVYSRWQRSFDEWRYPSQAIPAHDVQS